MGERKSSGGYRAPVVPKPIGSSPMSFQNQRLRKNSGSSKYSQDLSSGFIKRPPSQSSKNSSGMNVKPPRQQVSRKNDFEQ
jgi:hypothetical protein